MIYADYEFYTEHYCGTLVPLAEFEHYILKASATVDYYIGQTLSENEITDEVKYAVCEICDILYSDDTHEGLKYERNDGYWVSYDGSETAENKIKKSVKKWLLSSGLLYRGRNF